MTEPKPLTEEEVEKWQKDFEFRHAGRLFATIDALRAEKEQADTAVIKTYESLLAERVALRERVGALGEALALYQNKNGVWYSAKAFRAKEDEVARLREAFDVPGLTGVWAYRERGIGKAQWCATVIRGELAEDEDFYDTPWQALEAAKNTWRPWRKP